MRVLRKAREHLQLELADAIDPHSGVIDRLANDPIAMMDVIFLCCEEQMKEAGVDAADFSDSITGDTISEAANALINAIVDFFPKGKTEVIRESLALRDRVVERIKKRSMKALTDIPDQELERVVDQLVQKFGNSSMPVPESSV